MNDLLKRLQEPSSYAAIAAALAVFVPGIEQWAGWDDLAEFAVSIAAGVAFLMREKGA